MIEQLMEFGLSRLEAAAYIALLGEPGITGYRLSHMLDKPTANIYKALKSLEHKGLVRMDRSSPVRSIHPVPIEEFLSIREMQFKTRSLQLIEGLRDLEMKKQDYQISRLGSFEQAVATARQIISRAEKVLVLVAFEEVLKELEDILSARASEGVNIIISTYSPYALKGCRVYYSGREGDIWNWIPERAFDVAADGNVFMISNFRNNYSEVIEALYGNHVYLSLMIFNSLSKNILMRELDEGPELSDGAKSELREFLRNNGPLLQENLPGVQGFFRKHGIAGFEAVI